MLFKIFKSKYQYKNRWYIFFNIKNYNLSIAILILIVVYIIEYVVISNCHVNIQLILKKLLKISNLERNKQMVKDFFFKVIGMLKLIFFFNKHT